MYTPIGKYEFQISSDKTQPVECRHLYLNYYLKENAQSTSGLKIVRNYTNAIRKLCGDLIYEYIYIANYQAVEAFHYEEWDGVRLLTFLPLKH
jgi:hypothetical protein